MFIDLFCAALTTVCELVLPLIMRYITNVGLQGATIGVDVFGQSAKANDLYDHFNITADNIVNTVLGLIKQ